MDIANIIEVDSSEYELRHPTEQTPLGITFILAGPEHDARRDLDQQAQRRMRSRFSRTGQVQLDDPEEVREQVTRYLVGCTLGWRYLVIDGKPTDHSDAAAKALYENPRYAWIRRQIRAALDAQENFIRSSSPASSPTSATSSS